MRKIERISITAADRERLERLVRDRNTPQKVVWRARIVLLASDGRTAEAIAAAVGKSLLTVRRWRHRFVAKGVDGLLKDATRPSRVKPLLPEKIEQVVHMTLHAKPPNATHWSVRSMAKAAGISYSSVQRIWRAHGLKPHLVKTFKVSRDKHFAAKVDRTQPGLPMKKGRAGTMTHDYKRNGTTTLFAALNILDGKVIADCMPQHRHQEWLKFLRLIDKSTPRRKQLHLIIDNYSPHKHPAVQAWLEQHPRFHIHFTPTSASWLNMVERFFRDITQKQIRRGCFANVAELIETIEHYVAQHNSNPKPFVWTAKASDILEKVKRARAAFHKL